MINIIQFLSKKLNPDTLIKLHSITNDNYFRKIIEENIGFFPIRLNILSANNLIYFKQSLNIYSENNIIYVFNNHDEAIYINSSIKNNIHILTIYLSEFRNLSSLTTLINDFKSLFYEFYLDKCIINHSPDLIIKLKINKNIIELPPYISCSIIKDKKIITVK